MICPHCHKDTEVTPEALEKLNYAKGEAFLFRCKQETWFYDFWALFPRKVAKASALKAWKKVATSEAIKDEIMLGLSRAIPAFRQHIAKDGRQYIPHAATWLNGRRWEDEAGASGQTPAARVIACPDCGDSGIIEGVVMYSELTGAIRGYKRCSCVRGRLPGLVVPQGEANDSTPF